MNTLLFFVVIIAAMFLFFISIYNKLVRSKNLMQEGWSGIDVFLKKRHDLIPNLVETVKGYATHERETLDSVIQARAQALNAGSIGEKQAAENTLGKSLVNLFAVAEQYPDLKANTNFQALQGQLTNIEGEIEKARRYYNGTARDYNIAIESFPGNVLAGTFKFGPASYFEIEDSAERSVPQVKF